MVVDLLASDYNGLSCPIGCLDLRSLFMPNAFFCPPLSAILVGLLFLSGCSTLAPSSHTVIETNRSNITVSSNLSLRTQNLLVSAGYTQPSCMAEFDSCISEVSALFFDNNKKKLATIAELNLAKSIHLKQQPICKPTLDRPPIDPYYTSAPKADNEILLEKEARADCYRAYRTALYDALKHSYAYITYDSLTNQNTQSPVISEEQIKAQDIYHIAIDTLIDELYLKESGRFNSATRHPITQSTLHADNPHGLDQVPISYLTSTDKDGNTDTLHLYIANHPDYTANLKKGSSHALADLTSIYDASLPNLSVTSTRSGLGVGYVGSLDDRYLANLSSLRRQQSRQTAARIYPMGHILMTAIIIPTGDTLDEVLTSHNYHAYFFNPYTDQSVSILGKSYPLFANFSAGHAKWLSENQFQSVGIANLFNPSDARLPELFMLEPYDPNKRVIIMMHGLASSPKTWLQLTNSLLADPVLRDNYQVWQVFYSTNLPILENRHHIQTLLQAAFNSTDPTGTNRSSHNAVIISHSMGAVIARLMLSSDNLLATLAKADDPLGQDSKKLLGHLTQEDMASRFVLSPLSQVGTAVFISAPFQGTDYADRWLNRTLRRAIHLPASINQSVSSALATLDNDSPLHSLYLQDGASQLSDKSVFIKLTQKVNISPTVRYHSIMANDTENKDGLAVGEHISDGIVPYESSHLDGAASELILDGNHRIHKNPKTILHLRHILHDALKNNQ